MAGDAAAGARLLEFSGFKDQFQPTIVAELARLMEQYQPLRLDPGAAELYAAAVAIATEGSKRVRPYVGYLSYRTFGGSDNPEVLPSLCGLELLHVFALIHDDIMDHGSIRHGLPCVHVVSAESMRKSGASGDIGDVAKSQAILIGDAVFNWAYQTLVAHVPPSRLPAVLRLFQAMVTEVIVGQMLDVDTVVRRRVPAEAITRKTEMKTARYTYVNPIKIGAAIAGDSPESAAFAEAVGTPLGIAHQMQDDLLDIVGTPQVLGKEVLSDLRERQHTYFTQYVYDHGTAEQQAELDSYMGAKLGSGQSAAAIKLFHDSGAVAAGREQIAAYIGQARQQIQRLLPEGNAQAESWLKLVDFLEKRSR